MPQAKAFLIVTLCAAGATVNSSGTFQAASQDASAGLVLEEDGDFINIRAEGVPNHATGVFTYRNEVVTIREQNYRFRITRKPEVARRATAADRGVFGLAINGVPFDSRAEDHWESSRSGWSYEPLRNERGMEIDASHGHADRRGTYHYHGLPVGLTHSMGPATDMRLIGWAADGFPIYDRYGYVDPKDPQSGLKLLAPSYWVKAGNRTSGPGGPHDGRFTQDWEYVEGRGDLDECNGRTGVTPEFPEGTYYYVVTERFPGVPRYFKGTPDPSFTRRRR